MVIKMINVNQEFQ